jgi:hypothetical protein
MKLLSESNRFFTVCFLSVLLLRILWVFIYPEIQFSPDSVSYFYDFSIFNGDPHPFRVVIYPELINGLKIFGLKEQNLLLSIIIVQQLFSIAALIPLYKTLEMLTINKYIMIFGFVFIGLNPMILNYNMNINTESLTLSFLLFYLFYTHKNFDEPNSKNFIILNAISLLLLFTRPIFLFLVVFNILIMLFLLKKNISKKILLSITLTPVLVIFLFMNQINKKHHVFTISTVSLINDIANIVLANSYFSSDDHELVKLTSETSKKGFYNSVYYLYNKNFKLIEKNQNNIPKYLQKQTPVYHNDKIVDIPEERLKSFLTQSKHNKKYIKYVLRKTLNMIYHFKYFISTFICVLFFRIKILLSEKKLDVNYFSFAILITLNFGIVAIGGIDDWARLLAPAALLYMFFLIREIDILLNIKIVKYFKNPITIKLR